MNARNATIQRIRLLQALGPIKPRASQPRLPKPIPPDAIRLEYFKAIRPQACEVPRAALERVKPQILALLQDELRDRSRARTDHRLDAGARASQALRLVQDAANRAADAFRPIELTNVARQFGRRTDAWQKAQLDRQVRAAVQVPYSAIERPTRDRVPEWTAQNVDLIKTVPERYFGRIQAMVEDAFENGIAADDLAEDFEDTFDISENNATRIANDQIGKLAGQVDSDRQQSLGISKFIWRTVEDERVREAHAVLDGQLCSWDDPPVNEDTGEQIIPGQDINCRCWPDPYMGDLLDDDD